MPGLHYNKANLAVSEMSCKDSTDTVRCPVWLCAALYRFALTTDSVPASCFFLKVRSTWSLLAAMVTFIFGDLNA